VNLILFIVSDDFTNVKCNLQKMVNVIGSDPTEAACEKECHLLIKDGLLNHSCPLFCHAYVNFYSIMF
jgi:hypothetical protein